MSIRLEQYDGGEVLYIALDPDGVWARSDFPDELITIDYNAQGGVIGIEVVGSLARSSAAAMVQVLTRDAALENPDAVRKAFEPVFA